MNFDLCAGHDTPQWVKNDRRMNNPNLLIAAKNIYIDGENTNSNYISQSNVNIMIYIYHQYQKYESNIISI